MDVGQDRTAELVLDRLQDVQPLFHADAARGADAGAIGLVVARLVDKARAGRLAGLGDLLGHHQGVVHALDLARAGDQHEGRITADGDVADLEAPGLHVLRGNVFVGHQMTLSIRATSTGLLSSQKTRPRPSTSTQRIGVPFSRKRSCSRPSYRSSGPACHSI